MDRRRRRQPRRSAAAPVDARRGGRAEHGRAVEQDRRGHGRRLGGVPDRGIRLHGVRGDGRVRRPRRDRRHVRARGPRFRLPAGASRDAAVIEAAYETLVYYFPGRRPLGTGALRARRDRRRSAEDRRDRRRPRRQRTHPMRTGDGRQVPIGTTSSFPTKAPGPGVWRSTPPAYPPPQTPWAGTMTPFVLPSADRFLPPPPPLSSAEWVAGFNEIKAVGQNTSTQRTAAQTATAVFWTANVVRQDNRLVRDIADARSLGLLDTARLAAMVNVTDARRGDRRPERQVPLPVLAAGDRDRSDLGRRPATASGRSRVQRRQRRHSGEWRPLWLTPNHPDIRPPTARSRRPSPKSSSSSSAPTGSRRHPWVRRDGAAGNLDAVHRLRQGERAPQGDHRRPPVGRLSTTASRARPASTSAGASRSTT